VKVGDYEIPEGLHYTKKHEWAKVENSGLVRIGITDYAQKTLHEIVFVETPSVGDEVKQMDAIGTVESVKAVSEVFSPISGRVVEVNDDLLMSPELVNKDPYGVGWIALIEPADLEELGKLMNAAEYAEMLKGLEQLN